MCRGVHSPPAELYPANMPSQALITSFIPWATKALNTANSVKEARGGRQMSFHWEPDAEQVSSWRWFIPSPGWKLRGEAENTSKKMLLRYLARLSKQEMPASPTHWPLWSSGRYQEDSGSTFVQNSGCVKNLETLTFLQNDYQNLEGSGVWTLETSR